MGKSGTQELLAWPLIASPPPDGLVLRTAAQATSCLPALDVRIRYGDLSSLDYATPSSPFIIRHI